MDKKYITQKNNIKIKESKPIQPEKDQQDLGKKGIKNQALDKKKDQNKNINDDDGMYQPEQGIFYDEEPQNQEQQFSEKSQQDGCQIDEEQSSSFYRKIIQQNEEEMQEYDQVLNQRNKRENNKVNLYQNNLAPQPFGKKDNSMQQNIQQMNDAQQILEINDQCNCNSCKKLNFLEKRLAQLEKFTIMHHSLKIDPKQKSKVAGVKIRRKAKQIPRKYKCVNFEGCIKAYGTKSAIKLHIFKIHNIPINQISFDKDQIRINPQDRTQ